MVEYTLTATYKHMNRGRGVADSLTAGIFIRDTARIHCDSVNCDSQFSE